MNFTISRRDGSSAIRKPERFVGLTVGACIAEEMLGREDAEHQRTPAALNQRRGRQFMYLISEYAALVVLIVTLSALLFGFGVVILWIAWGIERAVLKSREVQQDTTQVFSPSAVLDAPHRAAIGAEIPVYVMIEHGEKHGSPNA